MLWPLLEKKGCKHVMLPDELRNMIKGENDTCRVAIDAYLLCHSMFSAEWRKLALEGCYDVRLVRKAAIMRIKQLAITFNRADMSVVFCSDGDKVESKVATKERIEKRDTGYRKVIKAYLECRKVAHELDMKRFRFLEEYTYLVESIEEPDLIVKDASILLDHLRALLVSTVFMPSDTKALMLDDLAQEFEVCRMPSISEGEKLCSILVSLGYCQAIYSGDGDSIVLGTRCVIRKIDKSKVEVYFYKDILRKFDMTDSQFVSMCIVMGSDFSSGVDGLGGVKSQTLVRQKGFDIHELNLKHCGTLEVNNCLEAFRISKDELLSTMTELERVIQDRDQ